MFGVPALCEIGGRGLVPRQHSAISTDAPDEVGAFVVADAPLVACLASLLRFCPQATLEDTFADMLEVAPVGATSIISTRQVGSRLLTCWKLRRLGRPAFSTWVFWPWAFYRVC